MKKKNFLYLTLFLLSGCASVPECPVVVEKAYVNNPRSLTDLMFPMTPSGTVPTYCRPKDQ